MKRIIKVLNELIEKIIKNHIDEYTSQCAYFTILAFIPLLMLILTLTKYVGIRQDSLFRIIESIFTSNLLNDSIIGIVKEVYSKSVGTITISAIFVLWSAGKGFVALCKGLYAAYEVEPPKKFMHFRIRAMICTIIFIGLIVLSLIVLVFGRKINLLLQEKFNIFSDIINTILNAKSILSIITLTLIFIMAYKLIPKHNYKLKYQIPGAIFAAVACNVLSMFYSIYVNVFTNFSIMYGSLTTAVLAMMWVYACMYCILLGANINNMICQKMSKKS